MGGTVKIESDPMGKTAEAAADRSGGTGRDPSGRRSGWRYAAEETTESGVVDTEFRGGGTDTEFRGVATETEDGFATWRGVAIRMRDANRGAEVTNAFGSA